MVKKHLAGQGHLFRHTALNDSLVSSKLLYSVLNYCLVRTGLSFDCHKFLFHSFLRQHLFTLLQSKTDEQQGAGLPQKLPSSRNRAVHKDMGDIYTLNLAHAYACNLYVPNVIQVKIDYRQERLRDKNVY